MLNFTFKNQTEILFGKGQLSEVSSRLPNQAKVLFLYGGGSIKKNGIYDKVNTALEGAEVIEFQGVEPNPEFETLMKAVHVARENNVNFILAVGGGSVIDGAKFVAAAVNFEGDPWDILVKGADFKNPLPIGAVLTLPATGSESNGNSVVNRKETSQKRAFSSETVQPVFAVLDPEFTYSLPPRQVSNGVVDAFVHVIEQYLTYPVNAPLQDRFAEGILQTLIQEGPKALATPEDYDVRANVMWSATMALNGLIGKGVPQDEKAIDLTIKAVQDFFETMQVKTRLSDYDIEKSAIDGLIKNLERNGLTALGEHGDIDLAKAREILTLAA